MGQLLFSPGQAAALLFGVFFLLLALRVPVAVALGLACLPMLALEPQLSLMLLVQETFNAYNSFILLAVPFFLLTPNLMNVGGITDRLVRLSRALVGHFPGGLAQINVVLSIFFAGISGSSTADAASQSKIFIEAQRREGYDDSFSVAITAVSAVLAVIIPPSILMIVWGGVLTVSIGALFLAGILPGVLMALLMMLTVAYFAHKNGWGGDVKFNGGKLAKALFETAVVIGWPLLLWVLISKLGFQPQLTVFVALAALFVADKVFNFQAVLPIMTPVLLIGGMVTGIFTPTEGAIAACVWSMILGFVWYRTINFKMFVKVCLDTVETTATVLFIVAAVDRKSVV